MSKKTKNFIFLWHVFRYQLSHTKSKITDEFLSEKFTKWTPENIFKKLV